LREKYAEGLRCLRCVALDRNHKPGLNDAQQQEYGVKEKKKKKSEDFACDPNQPDGRLR